MNNSIIYGTHVLAVQNDDEILIPTFYKTALYNKEFIIANYIKFAPIYDLTLKRTYQVFFSGIKRELLGLPTEIDVGDNFVVESLRFDESFSVIDILTILPQERKDWFINELYQNLFLEKGLYPTKNYCDSLDDMHPYKLFIPTKFTKSLEFTYSSIDDLVQKYYTAEGERFEKRVKEGIDKRVYSDKNYGLEYAVFKAKKMPRTRRSLYMCMYCGHKIGQAPLSAYYCKIASNSRKLTRRINKIFERRMTKYGGLANN